MREDLALWWPGKSVSESIIHFLFQCKNKKDWWWSQSRQENMLPCRSTHNPTRGRIKHLLRNWTNYMSGSGYGGAASGSGSSWTVNARSQGRAAKCLLIWPAFGCLVFLKGFPEPDSKNMCGNGLGRSSYLFCMVPKRQGPHETGSLPGTKAAESSSVTRNIP